MLNKNLSSNKTVFTNLFLYVFVFIAFSFLNLCPKTKLVDPAQAQEHPFLLVKESEYAEMRTRALTSPCSTMKTQAISDMTKTTYLTSDTYNNKISKLNTIVSSGALAYILDPANKTIYKNKVRDTLLQWDNLWASRTGAGWTVCVAPGSAFFNAVLALDIIYNDLTPEERTAIENKLAVAGDWWWNAMTPSPPAKPQSWGANGWGCAGIWAIYKHDTSRISTCAAGYLNWTKGTIRSDGIYMSGPSYAGGRFADSSRDAKTHFMDVLEYTGTPPDCYTDSKLRPFYEWVYGYNLTPFGRLYCFGDTDITRYGFINGSALFRAYKFSTQAARYASWAYKGKITGRLLHYIFYKPGLSLPAKEAPSSKIFNNGAWFLENANIRTSLAGAMWGATANDGHGHKEVNAINLCAYGEHVVRNSGYTGAGRGALGYDYNYINNTAVSGNTVLINNTDHTLKYGAGIVEGFTSNKFDYARGDSGSALPNGKHYRNFAFIHPQDGKNGYWLTYDEVTATVPGNPVNVALHPNSNDADPVIIPNREYKWKIGPFRDNLTQNVYITIFLGTPPNSVSIKDGLLARDVNGPETSCFIGKYLYSSYLTDNTGKKNIVTVLFPEDPTHTKAVMSSISGSGYSGANIDLGANVIDTALESSGSGTLTHNGVSFQGTAIWYRQNAGINAGYFVRQGKSFKDGAYGFDSNNPVSIHLKDNSGKIISSGANVKFSYPGISGVYINGIQTTPTISVPGVSMTVTVPSGTHTVSFNLTGPITTAPPAFSPAAGTYPSTQNVSISTATAGATIYYTLDGSDPAASPTRSVYSSPIIISSTKTTKAKAFKTGLTPSVTSQATYTINLSAASAPLFSPVGGTYASAQNVTISTATAGATIHYTIDGTTPTEASPIYSTPIAVSSNTTLKAGAWKTGMTPSTISSAAYTIGTLANLAPNPGFETDPYLNYAYYGTGTFSWASDYFHSGAKSLKIVSSQASGLFARWISKTNNISAAAGKTYTASVWMKTSNVSQYGELLINFWDVNKVYLNKYYISNHVSAANDWTKLTASGIAPANTKYVRLEFRLYGPGTIWVDDVELK